MSGDRPKVSVIIPVYNQGNYLSEAITSVLSQTWKDLELLVVDDGSTDNSAEVANSFGYQLRYFRKENAGGASALNLGIRNSRGEWVAWLSADDVWEPIRLARQLRAAQENPSVAFIYSDYSIIDAQGSFQRNTSHPVPKGRARRRIELLRGCHINGSTVLVRRSVFTEVGLFDETDRYAPDYDMWLRITSKYDALHVPEPLVRYRVHPGQSSMKIRAIWLATYRVLARTLPSERALYGLAAVLLRAWDQWVDIVATAMTARRWTAVRQRIGTHLAALRILVQ